MEDRNVSFLLILDMRRRFLEFDEGFMEVIPPVFSFFFSTLIERQDGPQERHFFTANTTNL